jgi:Na+/proline symporter
MILSLVWRGMTANGALAAMIFGFASVPFFKFVAPHIPGVGAEFGALEELAPSFAVSAVAGVLVSVLGPGDPPE